MSVSVHAADFIVVLAIALKCIEIQYPQHPPAAAPKTEPLQLALHLSMPAQAEGGLQMRSALRVAGLFVYALFCFVCLSAVVIPLRFGERVFSAF